MSNREEIIELPGRRRRDAELAANRVLDVVMALAGLTLFALLMIGIALAIKIDSRGPIFFSQVRLGKAGRSFQLYKFRKFHATEPTDGRPVTLKNDSRFTQIGKLLARTKLDELPQLWNVLKGDMSVVGPRPETLDFADCFQGPYRKVLDYKPGLFGPNQVFFRNESSLYPQNCDARQFYRDVLFPLKARVDLAYFPNRNAISDIAWTVRGTFAVVARPPPRDPGPHWLEKVEDWVRRSQRPDFAQPAVERCQEVPKSVSTSWRTRPCDQ